MEYTLLGLMVGFSVAAPIGPMGALCISRTLAHGRRYGVVTGLGESTVEAACAAVAVLGLGGLMVLERTGPPEASVGTRVAIIGLRSGGYC